MYICSTLLYDAYFILSDFVLLYDICIHYAVVYHIYYSIVYQITLC